jgi:hypothetical protein
MSARKPEAAPTPGPWVEFADRGETVAIMAAGRPGDVCSFAPPYPRRSDARLIAAAPAMLAALTVLAEIANDEMQSRPPTMRAKIDAIKAARAAIGLAEGR